MVNIRSHQAQAVLTAVTKAITEGKDLNQLNSNGASWVSDGILLRNGLQPPCSLYFWCKFAQKGVSG